MEFICSSPQELNHEQISKLSDKAIILKHKTYLDNIYVLESSSANDIKSMNLFSTVRESRMFRLAIKKDARSDVIFTPMVSKDELQRNQRHGWGAKIAVMDSGIDINEVNIISQESKDFTGYGSIIVNDHGTKVGKIIKFYAPGANVVSIKIAHYGDDIKEGTLLQALDYCIDIDVNIINMSLETGHKPTCNGNCDLCNYVNLVRDAGKIVVTVSGNFGEFDGNTVGCPGKAEKAITVGAIDTTGKLCDSSGKGTAQFLKPNLVAPGNVKVLLGNNYVLDSGTSFAAPIITGVIAALFIYYDLDFIIHTLYSTCTDLGYKRYEQGFGGLDIEKLLEVFDNEQAVSDSSSG